MTNRRFAVTRRSAARSSPARARRANRRSSSGSVIMGSFWMSWRYWSNAPLGEGRNNGRAALVFAIANLKDRGALDRERKRQGAGQNDRKRCEYGKRPTTVSSDNRFPHHKSLQASGFMCFVHEGLWKQCGHDGDLVRKQ